MMIPTPTINSIPFNAAEFASLADALDYAARGTTGLNFYNGKGQLDTVLPYRQLREEARVLARRLLGITSGRGARVLQVGAAALIPALAAFFLIPGFDQCLARSCGFLQAQTCRIS